MFDQPRSISGRAHFSNSNPKLAKAWIGYPDDNLIYHRSVHIRHGFEFDRVELFASSGDWFASVSEQLYQIVSLHRCMAQA